ncbi:MAG: hypothetical protein ABR499_13840 [Gemmatimonadaceae bacterium]
MRTWLPIAHLALTLVILAWNIALAGRISQVRKAPRAFAAITALAGFLIAPALALAIASSSAITGRALVAVDWLWPLTAVLFAVQAIYALARRLVNTFVGLPIAVYNLVVGATVVLRYLASRGVGLPEPALVLLAAQTDALTLVTGTAALTSPLFFNIPIISPAFPAARELTAGFRVVVAFLAAAWTTLLAVGLPRGQIAVPAYAKYENAPIADRPAGDFLLGVKILPDLARPPSVRAIRSDLALIDTLGVDAVSIVVVPEGAIGAVLDSVARVVEPLRRTDSTLLIVALGYPGKLIPPLRPLQLDVDARLRAVNQVVRRLRPDILVPAEDPYGAGARAFGLLPVETWQNYLTRASQLSKRLRPRTRVGVAASSFGTRDSLLYAWAVKPGSPIDIVGFSLAPSRRGAETLDAAMRAADRWIQTERPRKEHWVFSAGGLPLAHGEESQERALTGIMSWATSRGVIRGLIVNGAGDYGAIVGLRAPNGRLRPAALAVLRAKRGLEEAAAPGGGVTALAGPTGGGATPVENAPSGSPGRTPADTAPRGRTTGRQPRTRR